MKELIISLKKYEKYLCFIIFMLSIWFCSFGWTNFFFPHKQKDGIKNEKVKFILKLKNFYNLI